jgi:hypothetical protein
MRNSTFAPLNSCQSEWMFVVVRGGQNWPPGLPATELRLPADASAIFEAPGSRSSGRWFQGARRRERMAFVNFDAQKLAWPSCNFLGQAVSLLFGFGSPPSARRDAQPVRARKANQPYYFGDRFKSSSPTASGTAYFYDDTCSVGQATNIVSTAQRCNNDNCGRVTRRQLPARVFWTRAPQGPRPATGAQNWLRKFQASW